MVKKWSSCVLSLLIWTLATSAVMAQTTAFTYQGRLIDAGSAATGNYDLQFKLFDVTDAQQGPTLTLDDVPVTNGVFTVQLDFGDVFDGGARSLEIGVRAGASTGAFTVLSPRQTLSSTPYAVRSVTATNALLFGALPPSSFVQFDGNGRVGIGTDSPVTKLDIRGKLALDPGAGNPVVLYTASSGGEQNRYLELINSPDSPSASGLKAGGILVADNYNYAQPGKNDVIVKGRVAVGTPNPQPGQLSVLASGAFTAYAVSGTNDTPSGRGISGINNGTLGVGVYGSSPTNIGYAGFFSGHVAVTGTLEVAQLASGGFTHLCLNGGPNNQISTCSSSLRYKTDLHPFSGGLNVINRLRPITFKWKTNHMLDLGFAAEEVAEVEPLLTTRNDRGEIEGVKYDRLSAVFVNAFREQQAEITGLREQLTQQQQHSTRQQQRLKQQQIEIETLKHLVCLDHPRASICKLPARRR
jgi:endosialidase-like protein